MSNDLQYDSKKAINFLKHFRKDGFHNIVAIDPVSEAITGITRPIDSPDLLAFIEKNNDKRNLYYSVNEPKPDAPDDKLKKNHISKINAVWLDADPKKDLPLERERERLAKFAVDLKISVNPPTYITDSGNGIQAFWVLDKPLEATKENIIHAESLSRGLAEQYRTDFVQNIDRIMRIPFTVNIPTKTKKGRSPAVSSVIHALPERKTYKELDFITPSFKAESEATFEHTDLDIEAIKAPLPDDLLNRFKNTLERDKKAHDLYYGLIEKPSRSEYDFTLTQQLRWDGYSLQEVAHILYHYPHGKGNDLTKRDIVRIYNRVEATLFPPLDPAYIAKIEAQLNPILVARAKGKTHPDDLKRPDFNLGHIVNPASLVGLTIPSREWLIEDLIPHGTVSLLSGDGGLGKSLLMQQLMTSAATGRDWMGIKTRKCKAFGLFCEDDHDELWRRQKAICDSMSISLVDCFNMEWLSGDGIDPVLMEFGGSDAGSTTPLFDALIDHLERMEVELVIIDTAADTFAGNEISRIQVRNFINRALRVIANRLSATVILTSHPSRSGMSDGTGMSGSTAWNNSVRSRLYLTRPTDESNSNVRLLQMKKSNYGSTEPEIRIIWQDGVFHHVDSTIGKNPIDRDSQDETAYLHALMKLHERNQRPLISKNQPNYAPKLMKGMQETKGISLSRLEAAQNRLMDKKIIANLLETTGYESKRKCLIQIANPDMAQDIMNLKLF